MTITVRNDGDATIRIRAMRTRLKDMTPMWAKVGSYIAQVNRRQFATHGGYLGKPWKPLKPDYLQWKISEGYSKRTLVQTGGMRASFVSRPMSVEDYNGDTATFGSNHPLAKFHQHGTHRNGKRAIPARPIVVKTPKMTRDIRDIVAEYILVKSRTRTRKYL